MLPIASQPAALAFPPTSDNVMTIPSDSTFINRPPIRRACTRRHIILDLTVTFLRVGNSSIGTVSGLCPIKVGREKRDSRQLGIGASHRTIELIRHWR